MGSGFGDERGGRKEVWLEGRRSLYLEQKKQKKTKMLVIFLPFFPTLSFSTVPLSIAQFLFF